MARLVAPVDGMVVAVNIAAGSTAPSGAAITIQSDQLIVTAAFTETDLPSLAVNQPASVTVKAVNATIDGTVRSIATQASSGTSGGVVTYSVTIALTNRPADVRVGMSAQAAVTTAQAADVLTVPSVALSGVAGNYFVTVIDETGQPERVPVTVGLIANGSAEIQAGLDGRRSRRHRDHHAADVDRDGRHAGAPGRGRIGGGFGGGFGGGGRGGGAGGAGAGGAGTGGGPGGGAGGNGGGTRTTGGG